MRKSILITLFTILSSTILFSQSDPQPFQIALSKNVQIIPQELSVSGFRWNVFYGVNKDVTGFDMGIANSTNGYQKGAQLGIVNKTAKEFTGFRGGIFNFTGGKFNGYSSGIVNILDNTGNGLATGIVNLVNDDFKGLLGGVVNVQYAKNIEGAHIGVVSVINDTDKTESKDQSAERKGTQIGVVNVSESLNGIQIGLINVNKSARIKFSPFILISKKS